MENAALFQKRISDRQLPIVREIIENEKQGVIGEISMIEWSSEQYLQFQNQRTQPAVDLAKRIQIKNPQHILDIGCGPGNSTNVLKNIFPDAHILGIDNSENMIRKAQAAYTGIEFKLMSVKDICRESHTYDVIFSNACLQWVPNHKEVIPMLFDKLNENGMLAIQVPINSQEPLFQIISETVREKKWGFSSLAQEPNAALSGAEYFDILSGITGRFDIWETVYYHNMPSIDSMIEWVKGSRLLPYIQALNENEAQKLIDEISEKASYIYKKQKDSEIIFRFRRLFFTATH